MERQAYRHLKRFTNTTLSYAKLMKPVLGFLHPSHVLGTTDKEESRKDLLYEGARLRKRERGAWTSAPPFGLEKGVGDRADHHVMLPSRIAPAFEVIDAEFGLEVLVVLFDRPAVMGQPHELRERGSGWQRDEVMSATSRGSETSLAQQPDFWRESSMPPVGRRRDADRGEIRFPRRIGAVAPRDAFPRPRWQPIAEGPHRHGVLIGPALAAIARRRLGTIDAQRRRAAKHREGRRDTERIGQAQTMQRLANRAVVAVFGIRHDGGEREACRATAAHERQREAPLLLKADGRRNARPGASYRVAGPVLGQIQQGAHRPRARARPQRRRHRHLAIRDLAQRPAVLPRDADRMRARLRKTGFVEDQHPGALGRHAPQSSPQGLGLPRRMRDEMLKGLIRRRVADAFEHRRHRLARAVAQQAIDILPQRHVLGAMAEAVLELIQPPRQSPQQRRRVPIEHRTAAYAKGRICTMPSKVITRGFFRESDEVTKSY